jgi:hypothetical protein
MNSTRASPTTSVFVLNYCQFQKWIARASLKTRFLEVHFWKILSQKWTSLADFFPKERFLGEILLSG